MHNDCRIQFLSPEATNGQYKRATLFADPGPTNVPDRVRAIDNPTMDHRGPAFGEMSRGLLADIKKVFKTNNHVIIYPASGTGAWEAALVNTLSPGDRVLMYETGQFATPGSISRDA